MTTATERDIVATLRALTEGRIDAARAAATLFAAVLAAEHVAHAESRREALHEAARVLEQNGSYGSARLVRRMAPAPVVVPQGDALGAP